jgi:simple sugar transport system permease protein
MSVLAFLLTAFRLGTPIAYASLGGYASERSGTINIALEGMMLIGAFTAAVAVHHTHSAALGIWAAIMGSMLLGSLHGFLCIELGADQIISGVAVNFLAAGLPSVISKSLYDLSTSTPALANTDRVGAVFGVSPFVLCLPLVAALFYLLHTQTKLGQYLRFAGEHPEALQSQGINVKRVRWAGMLLCGALCGLAGAYLSIDHGGGFARNMTAGRGYIALAALIIGRWNPIPAVLAALAFGAVEASQILLQGVPLSNDQTVPVQWIQMFPYIVTLAILAGAAGGRLGKARPPKALGQPLLLGLLVFAATLTGCDFPTPNVSTLLSKALSVLDTQPAPSPKPAATPTEIVLSPDHRQMNAEFIREMFNSVLQRSVRGNDEVLKYMNIMDQGGHYEGIYNGIVYSEEFRAKEKGVAPIPTLKMYAELMTQIYYDQKLDPLRIPPPETPDVPPPTPTVAPPPQPTDEQRQQTRLDFEKEGITQSFYTLKRRLGEETLKTIELKREYKEKFATWYGRFTVFLNKKGVDFGLPQRNNQSEYFHYKWALDADEDRLKWECLNRIHVLMNSQAK